MIKYSAVISNKNTLYSFQVETTQMGFRSDKTLANSSLRKCLGQLLYLKNLAKVCLTV